MKLLQYLGVSSLIFSAYHLCLLCVILLFDLKPFSLGYHFSDELSWYSLYFLAPGMLALLGGGLIYIHLSKNRSQFLQIWGILNFCILLGMHFTIGYFSLQYWGYAFKRPAIFSEVQKAHRLLKASSVESEEDLKGRRLVSYLEELERPLLWHKEPYHWNGDRILLTLEANATYTGNTDQWYEMLTDTTHAVLPSTLNSLSQEIYGNDFIDIGSGNYVSSGAVYGRAIAFATKDSSSYIYLGLTGQQIANDHYGFYEYLFQKEDTQITLKKRQKFFFDDAGIEYEEYNGLSIFLISAAFILELALLGLLYLGLFLWRKAVPAQHKKTSSNNGEGFPQN